MYKFKMKALILAAGYATRLFPLTREYPKPLLSVAGEPIINYIIDKLQSVKEIDEIIVITNSKFILRFREWRRGLMGNAKRIILIDDLTKDIHDRRGAIGDMNFAVHKRRIRDDLLVIGGDNLFDEDLGDFISFARAKINHPVIGVYDLKSKAEAVQYGVVKLNSHGKVVDFKEKPKKPQSTLVAMCLYYFPKEKLGLIKEYLVTKADKHDAMGFYIDWLRKKVTVYAFAFAKRWYDIGHPKIYEGVTKSYGKV